MFPAPSSNFKLLICFRWGYYLTNFKTAGFNRSPTPPFLILTQSYGQKDTSAFGVRLSFTRTGAKRGAAKSRGVEHLRFGISLAIGLRSAQREK
jgi:hypothetical protein